MVHEQDDVITGFLIDNGTEVHMFVEGISHGYILEVWNKIHRINTTVAKVFLNSETEFEKRMYERLMVVGIYTISLKVPLGDILANQNIYVQGVIPVPCFKVHFILNQCIEKQFYSSFCLNLHQQFIQRWNFFYFILASSFILEFVV